MSEQNQSPAAPAAPAAPSTKKRQQPDLKQKVAQSAASAPAAPQTKAPALKTRNRHAVAFRHDIFVSDSKDCLKNVSYKSLQPQFEKVPHKHIFHSHTNNGKAMNRTGSGAGHFHYVEQWVDKDGNLRAKCGPAMHEIQVAAPNGMVFNKIAPVTFEKLIMSGEQTGETVLVADDHTHELEYVGSENLNPAQIKEELEKQQALAAAMGVSLGRGAVQATGAEAMNAADGLDVKGL